MRCSSTADESYLWWTLSFHTGTSSSSLAGGSVCSQIQISEDFGPVVLSSKGAEICGTLASINTKPGVARLPLS